MTRGEVKHEDTCRGQARHRFQREAAREVDLHVPLVVRLEGTNVSQGKDILANSGLPIIPANDLGDAAKKIVAEVKEAVPA